LPQAPSDRKKQNVWGILDQNSKRPLTKITLDRVKHKSCFEFQPTQNAHLTSWSVQGSS